MASTSYEDDKYFMAIAALTATRSKDPKTQVGACVVNQDNKIIGVGFNQMPKDSDGFPWGKSAYGNLDDKRTYVCHAELNAIVNSSMNVKNCKIYVTLLPCNECAKLIIQSGITEVYFMHDNNNTQASKDMFEKCDVKLSKFVPMLNSLAICFNIGRKRKYNDD